MNRDLCKVLVGVALVYLGSRMIANVAVGHERARGQSLWVDSRMGVHATASESAVDPNFRTYG